MRTIKITALSSSMVLESKQSFHTVTFSKPRFGGRGVQQRFARSLNFWASLESVTSLPQPPRLQRLQCPAKHQKRLEDKAGRRCARSLLRPRPGTRRKRARASAGLRPLPSHQAGPAAAVAPGARSPASLPSSRMAQMPGQGFSRPPRSWPRPGGRAGRDAGNSVSARPPRRSGSS